MRRLARVECAAHGRDDLVRARLRRRRQRPDRAGAIFSSRSRTSVREDRLEGIASRDVVEARRASRSARGISSRSSSADLEAAVSWPGTASTERRSRSAAIGLVRGERKSFVASRVITDGPPFDLRVEVERLSPSSSVVVLPDHLRRGLARCDVHVEVVIELAQGRRSDSRAKLDFISDFSRLRLPEPSVVRPEEAGERVRDRRAAARGVAAAASPAGGQRLAWRAVGCRAPAPAAGRGLEIEVDVAPAKSRAAPDRGQIRGPGSGCSGFIIGSTPRIQLMSP